MKNCCSGSLAKLRMWTEGADMIERFPESFRSSLDSISNACEKSRRMRRMGMEREREGGREGEREREGGREGERGREGGREKIWKEGGKEG